MMTNQITEEILQRYKTIHSLLYFVHRKLQCYVQVSSSRKHPPGKSPGINRAFEKNCQMPGPAGNFCWQMPRPRSFCGGQMPGPPVHPINIQNY